MQTLLNTLYLTLPGYLHLDNDTLRFDVERVTRIRVPLHHIGSVVCFGEVLISSAAMSRLATDGKSLVLLDRNGRFKARLEGPVNGNILLRKAQFAKSDISAFALEHAKSCIAGKLKNSRQLLLRSARNAGTEGDAKPLRATAQALAADLHALQSAPDLEVVRGLEGDAAHQYFTAFTFMIRDDQRVAFALDGRSRRPPQDRMNALLSFLYSMLMNDCRSALETVGLDPQLGYLHTVRSGRASLALDLMEEFRSVIADRLALALVNLRQVQAEDFDLRPTGAVQMHDNTRKIVVIAYQKRKQELAVHPLLKQKMPIGLLPQIQARLLARVIRGEVEHYLPYLED